MSDPFLGEIRMVGFNFAPHGWAFCNGQIMPIQQNTALFSLLGTMYGGNGTSTFGLPNLQGNVPLGQGQGPGLSDYVIGQTGGEPSVTLLNSELPQHNHLVAASSGVASSTEPAGNVLARSASGLTAYSSTGTVNTVLAPSLIGLAGGSQPHNNMMPSLTVNFCIALSGVFPARN